jgi:hypothetical protein
MSLRKLTASLVGVMVAAGLAAAETPRLAVIISVDQMRADYLTRFRPWFGSGGFNRMLESGRWYTNSNYQHGYTVTAPGHATIGSGVNADIHGIIANDWIDRATLLKGNAVEDRDSPLVGLPPRVGRYRNPTEAAKAGRSPRNFLGVSVGDRLKAKYGAAAKVIGVADKDRSAILMAGPRADAAYWTEEGVFVTSTYYRRELPVWATDFNAAVNAAQFYGRTWDRLLPAEVYERVQGPDDAPGEELIAGLPGTFPKRITGTGPEPTGDFFTAYDRTPWNNEQVVAFAERVIEAEQLGQDEVPDLLAIGFSQTDAIGHTYGPDSHEVMDSYVRLDRALADLFAFLDARVGLSRCVIVLTADHGIGSMPERLATTEPGTPSGRVKLESVNGPLGAALDAEFGALPDKGAWFLRDGGAYYIHPAALAARGVTSAQVEAVIKRELAKIPWMGPAYTRTELTGTQPLDEVGEMTRRSFNVARSADVFAFLRDGYTANKAGMSHGTPFRHDTQVPQLWYGVGVPSGQRDEPVHVEDIAPTLAAQLGVDLPTARGRRLF